MEDALNREKKTHYGRLSVTDGAGRITPEREESEAASFQRPGWTTPKGQFVVLEGGGLLFPPKERRRRRSSSVFSVPELHLQILLFCSHGREAATRAQLRRCGRLVFTATVSRSERSATMWPSSSAPPPPQPCAAVDVTHWHTFTYLKWTKTAGKCVLCPKKRRARSGIL